MKHRFLNIIILSTLLFTSCKKSNNPAPGEQPSSQSYQPVTTGSTWTYKNTSHFTEAVDTTTFVMQAETKNIGGRVFNVLKGSNNEFSYFSRDNNLYLTTQEDEQGDGLIMMEYLNDRAPAGTMWTKMSGIYQLKTSIIERNLTKVIFNKTYNEVIHSRIEYQEKEDNVYQTQLIMDFYAAKGIGMIQTSVSTPQFEIARSEIISASIK